MSSFGYKRPQNDAQGQINDRSIYGQAYCVGLYTQVVHMIVSTLENTRSTSASYQPSPLSVG